MGTAGATIATAFCKMASRLRQTHTFKKLHSATSASSTRNAHVQNQVASRLRETLLFLENHASCLRETPTLRGSAEPSPAELSRTEPSRAEQKSKRQNKVASRLHETLYFGCLQDLSGGHFLSKCVSSTRNNACLTEIAFRLHEPPTFGCATAATAPAAAVTKGPQ